MIHNPRNQHFALAILSALLIGSPGASLAAVNDCAVDYDLDLARTPADFAIFVGLFGAGSSNADLNADTAIDNFDLNTFTAYFGFAVCPWKADYQYNRVIDTVDWVIFQNLWANGSLRADLDNDGVVSILDFNAFAGAFGTVY